MFDYIDKAIEQHKTDATVENTIKEINTSKQVFVEDWVINTDNDLMPLIDMFLASDSQENMYIRSDTAQKLLRHVLDRLMNTCDSHYNYKEKIEELEKEIYNLRESVIYPNYDPSETQRIEQALYNTNTDAFKLSSDWSVPALYHLLEENKRLSEDLEYKQYRDQQSKYAQALADLYLEERKNDNSN